MGFIWCSSYVNSCPSYVRCKIRVVVVSHELLTRQLVEYQLKEGQSLVKKMWLFGNESL